MIRFLPLAAIALLAACAGGERAPPVRPSQVRPAVPIVPRPRPEPGDLVLGRTASALVASFGTPALDVEEGAARKLQFVGQVCVLDAYLYPPNGRGEPVAIHVDARLPDGRDTDRTACAQSLRRP